MEDQAHPAVLPFAYVGEIVHVRYDVSGLAGILDDGSMPCRAAVVAGKEVAAGLPVTVLPPFKQPFNTVTKSAHRPQHCEFGYGWDRRS